MKAVLFNVVKEIARLLMRTPLRYLPGARSVYERAYKRLAPHEPMAVECEGSWIYVDPRDIGVSLYLITERTFEPRITDLFKRILEPGMTVVDGGANIGYFTLLSARLVGDSGRVYAFEPEPRNAGLLRQSVERNRVGNVELAQSALSDRAGTARLFVDRSNFGGSSLLEDNVGDPVSSHDVETVSLDRFLTERGGTCVDLLKLDVEGAEGLALAGAEQTLGSGSMHVVMEFSPRALRNLGTDPAELLAGMRERGFEAEVLDHRSGKLNPCRDAELIADCEARDGGRGFGTVVLQR